MKKTKDNLEHRIQLLKSEIANYQRCIANYSEHKMQRCGAPYLQGLTDDLIILENELAERNKDKV